MSRCRAASSGGLCGSLEEDDRGLTSRHGELFFAPMEPAFSLALPATARSWFRCVAWLLVGMFCGGVALAQEPSNHVVVLDGAGSYVELPDRLGEDWEEATIEFLVKWDAFTYYATPLLFGDDRTSIGFVQAESANTLKLYAQKEAGQPVSIGMDGDVDAGKWIHLAGTWNRSEMRFWVNGSCVGTNRHGGDGLRFLASVAPRWLGRSPWKENGYFRGRIDELRLWRRVLSDSEMRRLPGFLPDPTEPGLVARWSMEEGAPDPAGTILWSTGERRLPASLRGRARLMEDGTPRRASWSRPWVLSGKVRDPSGGSSVVDVEWRRRPGGKPETKTTRANATFTFRGLEEVPHGEVAIQRGRWGVRVPVSLIPSQEVELDLVLRDAVSIEGRTAFLDGRAASDVLVRAVAERSGADTDSAVFTTRTDPRGEFRFVALPEGAYKVSCDSGLDPLNPSTRRPALRSLVRVQAGSNPPAVTFELPMSGGHSYWRQWTRREGLPDHTLGPLALDSRRLLWLGSVSGLTRFDGQSFTTWSTRDGLPPGPVTALHFDAAGGLWIGTPGGITVLEGDRFRSVLPDKTSLPLSVTDMAGTPDGSIWIGSTEGLLWHRSGTWRRFGVEHGLPALNVRRVWPAGENVVEVITEGGVVARVGDAGVEIRTHLREVDPELGAPSLLGMPHPGSTNATRTTWKGEYGVLGRGDGTSSSFRALGMPLEADVSTVLVLGDQEAWVSTRDLGLWHYGTPHAVSLTSREGLPAAPVRVSLRTRDGALWIGTTAGLVRWHQGVARLFGTADGLPHDSILSVHEAPDGTLWVGTHAGIACQTEKGFRIPFDSVAGIFSHLWSAQDGAMRGWVKGLGLWGGTSARWAALHPDRFQPYAWAAGVVPSVSGKLWLLMPEGAFRIGSDIPSAPQIQSAERLDIEGPSSLLEARDGSLWVGTWSHGIHRRDPEGRWHRVTASEGLASSAILYLHEDSRGWIWVGTPDGASLYRNGEWSILDTTDGLAGSRVHHIRSEPDGSLWFSTDGGLTRYSPGRVPPKVSWIEPSPALPSSPLTVQPAALGVSLRFRVASWGGHRFRWRVGSDKTPGTWTELRSDRAWTWTPEADGTFEVEAQAFDRDLNASETLRCTVLVRPLWYQDPKWVIPGLLVVSGGAAWVSYLGIHLRRQRRESRRLRDEARTLATADRMRMEFERRLLRTQEAERDRIARELHDSLGQELLLIRHAALLARQTAEAAPPGVALDQIAERAARTIREVRSIAYALRPQELSRYGLATAMRSLCDRLSDSHGIPIEFSAPPELPKGSADIEIGLFRILQECLTNALKHSDSPSLSCVLAWVDSGLELRVADQGRGFDPDEVALSRNAGFGLPGMRERVRLLGGRFRLTSTPGQGTLVEVWVPADSPDLTPSPSHQDSTHVSSSRVEHPESP